MSRNKVKLTLITISIIIIFILMIYPLEIRKFFLRYETINKTYTADNLLTSQEWFEKQYETIKSQEANLELIKKELDSDKNNKSLKESYYAQLKIINSNISEYNAKMKTLKNKDFASKHLPSSIELKR